MNWEQEKHIWPHSEISQFIDSSPHRWHIQDSDSLTLSPRKDPILLLIHGAGASTHSWRLILERMRIFCRVIAIDLPGHGFTKLGARNRSSLDLITKDLALMLKKLNIHPNVVAGHSAGSAIAINLALKTDLDINGILCLNGALGNFPGLSGILYPFLAKVLALSPFTVPLFTSLNSSGKQVEKFLALTGSKISQDGLFYYQKLISDKSHVEGALAMMSQWNLNELTRQWQNLEATISFILGEKDKIVKNSDSIKASTEIRNSEVHINTNHGHLMHEEDPDLISNQIKTFCKKVVSF